MCIGRCKFALYISERICGPFRAARASGPCDRAACVTVLTQWDAVSAHHCPSHTHWIPGRTQMNRIILLVIFLVGLSGCIKVQMPDDLVSDTVEAIKNIDDDEPAENQTDGASTFSHSIVGAADEPELALMQTCRSELESRTTELLDAPDVTFTLVSENVSVTGDKAIATCTVAVEQLPDQLATATQE